MKDEHPGTYVGIDVSKDTLSIAVDEPGRNGEVQSLRTIPATRGALDKLPESLQIQFGH